ncbi:MAG: hypothetical protein KDC34_08505 [Saprospiraceae bacterium]|nr:hypothetical protein [Saprospiraceae bacterium]
MKSFLMYLGMTLALGMISQAAIAQAPSCKAMKSETTACSAKAEATSASLNAAPAESTKCGTVAASPFQLVFNKETEEPANCNPGCAPASCAPASCKPLCQGPAGKTASLDKKETEKLALKEEE